MKNTELSEASIKADNIINNKIIKYLIEYNLKSSEKLRVAVALGKAVFKSLCE